MNEIDGLVGINETVLWKGKPEFWPFFIKNAIVPIFILVLVINLILPEGGELKWESLSPSLVFKLLLNLFLIWFILYYHKNEHYLITNKGAVLQGAWEDPKRISFSQIKDIKLHKSAFDALFNRDSGTIIISTPSPSRNFWIFGRGEQRHMMKHVPNAKAVFQTFKSNFEENIE